MKLDFERSTEINLSDVSYSDVIILADGSIWLIIKDTDGCDFRGVNLETFELTSFQCSIEKLVEWELCDKVARIIKSDNLVMGVK